MRFDPEYVSEVLSANFADAKTLFLEPLMAIHYAHLVMLADRAIITADDARRLRDALDSISLAGIRCAPYDESCEDLFFHVEQLLVGACGDDVAGRLHTARSRNDIDMTMYRMRQREWILALLDATLDLREALVAQAGRHLDTVFAAHTHTQPAQPTTIAHYLLAFIEQLERDGLRLQAAFDRTNRSPLGACAITGTGFPIDRHLTSTLLGFDGPLINTYGSIATVDYLLEGVSALAVTVVGVGRFVQDMLQWCTPEFGYLRLADGLVQSSTIMPQKRNPVALEHARAIGSKALGQATAVMLSVHNTPFGDIVDTEDDLQPLVASTYHDARRAVTLVAVSMRGAEFDVARLAARAEAGGTTLTELADHLVRDRGISFKVAHAIAARLHAEQQAHPDSPLGAMLTRVAGELLAAPVEYSDAEVAHLLSARHFVEVRRTPGGPAHDEADRALDESRDMLAADRVWQTGSVRAIAAAEQRLRERARAL